MTIDRCAIRCKDRRKQDAMESNGEGSGRTGTVVTTREVKGSTSLDVDESVFVSRLNTGHGAKNGVDSDVLRILYCAGYRWS